MVAGSCRTGSAHALDAARRLRSHWELPLAGFGNYSESSLPMVSLTSLDFDYTALGRDAAAKAVARIEGREIPHESIDVPMTLHVRASSDSEQGSQG